MVSGKRFAQSTENNTFISYGKMHPSYRKGIRFERELVNQARKDGKIAFRSAGSHSPIDVCIIDTKLRIIRLIQAKAGKHSQKALNHLRSLLEQHDGTYLVKFEVEQK